MTSKDIVVGSGKFYMIKKDSTHATMPTTADIAVVENLVGNIEGGFSINYGITTNTVSDDLKEVEKTFVTEENPSAKLGLITWNGRTLEKVVKTASCTVSGSVMTTELGGIANANFDQYWCCFVPTDTDRITSIAFLGEPITSLAIAFAAGTACKVEPEFKPVSYNSNGRKFKIEENVIGG